jgi:hypothetical protein
MAVDYERPKSDVNAETKKAKPTTDAAPGQALSFAGRRAPRGVRGADHASIMALQRLVGNRAVHSMLQGGEAKRSAGRSRIIQTKSTLTGPEHASEREADAVAERVVGGRVHGGPPGDPAPKRLTAPQSAFGGGEVPGDVEAGIQGARGGGHPLPRSVRATMESELGADLSGVRVHHDSHADRLNDVMRSEAFTTEKDIFVRQAAYRPDDPSGIKLLAHEVTHVAQQAQASAPAVQLERKPGHKYIRLFHEDRYVDVAYDPSKISNEAELTTVLAQATNDVAKLLTTDELYDIHWNVFEGNLVEWMNKGFDGMLPLTEVVGGQDEEPETLIESHGFGIENELRKVKVRYKGNGGMVYDMTIASTPKKTVQKKMNSHGKVTLQETSWPLLTVATDQVDKPKDSKQQATDAVVELKFGPGNADDAREIETRAKVTAIFEEAAKSLWGAGGQYVSVLVKQYNTLLLAEKDEDLHAYVLEVTDHVENKFLELEDEDPTQAAIEREKHMVRMAYGTFKDQTGDATASTRDIQTNMEVPIRKLGAVDDETIPRLWNEGSDTEKEISAMFVQARTFAEYIVNTDMRPIAAELQGNAFEASSIDLSRLQSTLTLALYTLSREQDSGKGAVPVLEKTGFGDMIREVLNLLEKTVLWQFTATNRWEGFKKDLLDAAEAVRDIKKTDFDRTDEGIQNLIKAFQHDSNEARWGQKYSANEDTAPDDLGRPARLMVDVGGKLTTGSRTGKPLATTYNYYRRGGLIIREPKVVLEVRRVDNPINMMQTSLINTGKFDDDSTAAHKRITSAAKSPPLPSRPVLKGGALVSNPHPYIDDLGDEPHLSASKQDALRRNEMARACRQYMDEYNRRAQSSAAPPLPNNMAPMPPSSNVISSNTAPMPPNSNLISSNTAPMAPNSNLISSSTAPMAPNSNLISSSTAPMAPNSNLISSSTSQTQTTTAPLPSIIAPTTTTQSAQGTATNNNVNQRRKPKRMRVKNLFNNLENALANRRGPMNMSSTAAQSDGDTSLANSQDDEAQDDEQPPLNINAQPIVIQVDSQEQEIQNNQQPLNEIEQPNVLNSAINTSSNNEPQVIALNNDETQLNANNDEEPQLDASNQAIQQPNLDIANPQGNNNNVNPANLQRLAALIPRAAPPPIRNNHFEMIRFTNYWLALVESGSLGPIAQIASTDEAQERFLNELRATFSQLAPNQRRGIL